MKVTIGTMMSKLPGKVANEVASGVSELYLRYNCNYCQEDIPGLRIKCAECLDFDLCLDCFACGAQIAKHKSNHKYLFMNNGGFTIFPSFSASSQNRYQKRSSTITNGSQDEAPSWNAREEMRLLDAVEQFGYGNWKDIARYIETKTPEQAKEEYIRQYIHGLVGKHTWKEELRGYQIDHTQAADRGPLSPTLTGKLPPITVSGQEALLLGYMPHRDDYEDFDKETEFLVAQIADKSVEDEDLDVALKLSQCDIYERRLREQVRRKRVARDYQLVSRFYRENPIVQIGFGAKISPQKMLIANQVKAVKKGDGPKQELMDALKCVTQFHTAQEFHQFINNLCVEKELKVRVRELSRYRDHGLKKQAELIPFERQRFKREMRLKARKAAKIKANASNPGSGTNTPNPIPGGSNAPSRFLPQVGDYCLKAVIDIDYEDKAWNKPISMKRRPKKSKWSRKKEKTGRRLLLKHGCILTIADPKRGAESTDGDSN
jgi:transcriptional adapter 2-beta